MGKFNQTGQGDTWCHSMKSEGGGLKAEEDVRNKMSDANTM